MLKTLIFHKTPSVFVVFSGAHLAGALRDLTMTQLVESSLLARVGCEALQMCTHSSHLLDTIRTICFNIQCLSNNFFIFHHCRVSFGSSKGSMVETLIFETPTPLPEHAEREFFSSTNHTDAAAQENGLNDSGIELQEE